MRSVDLNIDISEGYPYDIELMNYASSVNIACGYHAGDHATMMATAIAAAERGLAIGAHPSYPDRENFGRELMVMSDEDLFSVVEKQIVALLEICKQIGAKLHHVKPHGALYNFAAVDENTASVICAAVKKVDPQLIVYGLSGSLLITVAEQIGLRSKSEVFADRGYTSDRKLVKRGTPGALIDSADDSAERVLDMINYGRVGSIDGEMIEIKAETICLHGDTAGAVAFAKTIREQLDSNGIVVGA